MGCPYGKRFCFLFSLTLALRYLTSPRRVLSVYAYCIINEYASEMRVKRNELYAAMQKKIICMLDEIWG